jgi:hypothetical protein
MHEQLIIHYFILNIAEKPPLLLFPFCPTTPPALQHSIHAQAYYLPLLSPSCLPISSADFQTRKVSTPFLSRPASSLPPIVDSGLSLGANLPDRL